MGNGVAGRSRDLRSAIAAAGALFHVREQLPSHAAISRGEAEHQCHDYALLGDLVNAAKHKTVSRPTPHGAPLIADAEQLVEQIDIIEYEDDEGAYRFARKNVIVKLGDGTQRSVLEIVAVVMNFWERHLFGHGLLPAARQFRDDTAIRFRSRNECAENRLNFESVEGQRFHQSIRLLRFDNQAQSATPIDLTGAKLTFRAYRPAYEVDLSLHHEASGRMLSKTVVLGEDESSHVALIEDPAMRQEFISRLPIVQNGLRELAIEAGLVALPDSANSSVTDPHGLEE